MSAAPRRIERVVVCGAGAVGSSYVARLHQLDPACVAVVAGGARRERLLRDGLTVNGRRYPVRCLAPGESAPADLLLVAVKHHHLAAAVEDVRAVVGADTVILSVLNGITNEALLAGAFGAEKVLHGFVVGNDVLREGTTTRYTRIGQLVFGAVPDDALDPRVMAVKELLDRAGIPNRVPADIRREQWWKWMLNVGVNQVSAVLRAPFGAFSTIPEVRELTSLAALEVVRLAAREGVGLVEDDVARIFPIIATLAPDGRTSMLQDVDAGRKTEVEIFAGTVGELGRRHGVPTPVNDVLGKLIAALERAAGARQAAGTDAERS